MITRVSVVVLFIVTFLNIVICEPFELSVLHINDFHGRFDETTESSGICKHKETCIGGFSRLYKLIDTIQKNNPNTVILNAGDDFAGTIWYTVGKWNITQEFMNKIKFDAQTIGNHEFEDGVDNLEEYLKHLNHPILVANMDASSQPNMQGLFKKSTIIERNGKKIGIIGVIYSDVSKTSSTGNLTFFPESSSINAEAERLVKEEGVFTNIILSHCGYNIDQKLASNASEKISLIVGAHSHTFLYTGDNPPGPDEVGGPYPTIVNSAHGHKILVVQASSYCRYLGNITVFLGNNGEVLNWSGAPIFLSGSLPQDETINRELDPWRKQINAIPNPVLGNTLVTLNKWRCSKEECTMGNFVTDAMVYAYTRHANETAWTEAAIAVADSEGMRTNLEQGDITEDDLRTALPYENTYDVGEIEGSKLKDLFEYNTILEENGHVQVRLLQVSGIKLVLNLTQPYGSKVQSLKVRCQICTIPTYEEMNPKQIYRIVVDSYIATGGNNYTVLTENLRNRQIGPKSTASLKEYLAKRSPVYEDCGTRIVVYEKKDESASSYLKKNVLLFITTIIILKLF